MTGCSSICKTAPGLKSDGDYSVLWLVELRMGLEQTGEEWAGQSPRVLLGSIQYHAEGKVTSSENTSIVLLSSVPCCRLLGFIDPFQDFCVIKV